jgi:hypothetical protein
VLVLLRDDRLSGFVQKVNENSRQFNTYGLIFGVTLYNLYVLVDISLVPEIIWLDLTVRLFIITPLLFLYFPARYYAISVRPDAVVHEVLHGLGCMMVVASIMFIYANAQTSSASEYYMGIVTVVLYMNTIHRKPFPLAVMGTVGCMAVFIIGMEYVTVTSEVAKLPAIMCSVGISAVSLFAAYRIEQVERRDYLASLREKTLLQRIQNANHELQQLSNTSPASAIAAALTRRRTRLRAATAGRGRSSFSMSIISRTTMTQKAMWPAMIACAGSPAGCAAPCAGTMATEVSSRVMVARNLWFCSTIALFPLHSPSVKD